MLGVRSCNGHPIAWSFTTNAVVFTGQASVPLGTAGTFAILTKSGITDVFWAIWTISVRHYRRLRRCGSQYWRLPGTRHTCGRLPSARQQLLPLPWRHEAPPLCPFCCLERRRPPERQHCDVSALVLAALRCFLASSSFSSDCSAA